MNMQHIICFAAWYCQEPDRDRLAHASFGVTTFLLAAWVLAWDTRINLETDIQDLQDELAALGVSVPKN
jgi:type II secretory pathway component PulM